MLHAGRKRYGGSTAPYELFHDTNITDNKIAFETLLKLGVGHLCIELFRQLYYTEVNIDWIVR